MLAADLIDRLSARAANPETRNDMPGRGPQRTDSNVFTFETPACEVAAAFGLEPDRQPDRAPLPLRPPASPDDISKAETLFGFPLPDDLRQLYTTVANGGFGPGSGICTVEELISYYEDLRANPPGEGGQQWPADLLPFNRYDTCCDCYDRRTGEILFWDEETLLDGPGDGVWQQSFTKTAASLAAYLQAWLDSEPVKAEQRYVNASDAGFPDSDVVIDMWTVKHLCRSIGIFRQSPDQRESSGLPMDGWEEELCNMIGVDPEIYLRMVKRLGAEEF